MTISAKYANRSTLLVGECAEILSCTAQHVRNLIVDHKLVAISIGRSQNEWRVEAGDLIRFMQSQRKARE